MNFILVHLLHNADDLPTRAANPIKKLEARSDPISTEATPRGTRLERHGDAMEDTAGRDGADARASVPDIVASAAPCEHYLDGADRVIFVNERWSAVAAEHGPAVQPANVLGRPIWDFVAGQETRYIYMLILNRVRFTQISCALRFRCDSPVLQRAVEMRVSPLPGDAVQFTCRALRAEPRPLIELPAGEFNGTPARMCSFCKRVSLTGVDWTEAPSRWLAADPDVSSRIEHVVCPRCFATLNRSLNLHAKVTAWEGR
jgi:hypothetical protein